MDQRLTDCIVFVKVALALGVFCESRLSLFKRDEVGDSVVNSMITRFISVAFIAVAFVFGISISASLAAQAQPAVPCSLARITIITMPTGEAKYQAGVLRLSNGGSLPLVGAKDSPALYPVTQMKTHDAVAACYSDVKTYADAGLSRTITILDLRTAGFYGSLTGTWPPQ